MRLTVEQIKQRIAADRERIRAKVLPEVEAHFAEIEDRQATETAETNAMVEVRRERQQQRESAGQSVTPTGDTTEEVDHMAISTPIEPYTKAKQVGKKRAKATKAHDSTLARAQAGAKKGTASQRVKAAATAKDNGHKVGKFDAQAKKSGVEIKLWKKGSQADPKHVSVVFYVLVGGTRSRALSENFETLAEARKACKVAGFPIKSEPEKAAK